jgi:hypothetical protein
VQHPLIVLQEAREIEKVNTQANAHTLRTIDFINNNDHLMKEMRPTFYKYLVLLHDCQSAREASDVQL